MSGTARRLTFVIPTFNRKGPLRDCLASLARSAPGVPVLVVDDGSTDGTAELLAREFPSARLLRLEENRGPAAARNRALAAAGADYLAFLDSDIELTAGWLGAVAGELRPDTILAGRVDRPDGTREWGPRRTRLWGGSTPCDEARADVASSNNLVVPVTLAKAIGGFSEDLGFYFEDTYFCICARRAGYRVRYLDGARVIHHHDSRPSPERARRFGRNRAYAMVKDSRHPVLMAALQLSLGLLGGAACLIQLRSGSAWTGLGGVIRGIRDAAVRNHPAPMTLRGTLHG